MKTVIKIRQKKLSLNEYASLLYLKKNVKIELVRQNSN